MYDKARICTFDFNRCKCCFTEVTLKRDFGFGYNTITWKEVQKDP